MEKFLEKLRKELDNVDIKDKEIITLSGKMCRFLRARRAKAIMNLIIKLNKEEWLYDKELLRSELGQDILATILVGEDKNWDVSDIEVMKAMKTVKDLCGKTKGKRRVSI